MNEMIILVSGLVSEGISFKFEMQNWEGLDGMEVTFIHNREKYIVYWNPISCGYNSGLLEVRVHGNGDLIKIYEYAKAVDILGTL